MIDYWEAIGRLGSDADLATGFVELIEKHLPPDGKFPCVTVKRPEGLCTGVEIPRRVYEEVQSYLEPFLTEQCLSLTSAGELIWAFSYESIRKFTKGMTGIVSKAQPKLSHPSTSYFIALGSLVADGQFRKTVLQHQTSGLERLRRLPAPHVKNLHYIIQHPKFQKHIKLFEELWPDGCLDRLLHFAGHVHPLGLKATGAKVKRAGGAAGY